MLRGQPGELEGLALLAEPVRDRVVPLVEVVPGRVDGIARRLAATWGGERPVLLDTAAFASDALIGDRHHLVELFETCRGMVRAVPVGGVERGIDHTAAIAGVVAAHRKGAALRLQPADLAVAGKQRKIDTWLAVVDLPPADVDLILDVGRLSEQTAQATLGLAGELLESLPYAADWRSVTLAGGAFPQLPPNGYADYEHLFKRLDWNVWSKLAANRLPRSPGFGDHVLATPGTNDMQVGVTLAYTTGCSWLVVRRRRLAPRSDEMRAASQAVLARPEYAGPEHCRGCAVISECAAGGTPGRLETWRAAGTCHHIETSVAQVAAV